MAVGEQARRDVSNAPVGAGVARTAAALVLGSFATSAVGVAFWLVAARHLDRAELGRDAATLSLVMLAAALGGLDWPNALPRYLPGAGSLARRLVRTVQTSAVGLAVVVGLVLVVIASKSAPDLAHLLDSPWQLAAFSAAVVVWSAFSLQDAVLIGLGRERWLLVGNFAFALAKLGVLVVVARSMTTSAVVVSWIVPALVIVVVVQVTVVRPSFARTAGSEGSLPPAGRLAGLVLTGAAANVVGTVVVGLMPLVVTAHLGSAATAGYQLAWSAAYVLFLAPRYVAQAVLARAGTDTGRLDSVIAAASAGALALVGLAATVAVVAAGPVLGLVGSSYRDDTTGLLRLMALAAVPHCVLVLAGAWARGHQRPAVAVAVTSTEYLTVMVLALVLVPRRGLVGMGWAWLVGETLVAAVVLIAHRRMARRRRVALVAAEQPAGESIVGVPN
jgi:O-antigen/teichoic acid export membrane protein